MQTACDIAKFIPARLCGLEVPVNADDERSYAEIQTRVRGVVELLASVTPNSMIGAEDRRITLKFFPEGTWLRGTDYLSAFALPNFYFHVTTVYAILRHNGVPLGKRDYMGSLPFQS